MINAYNLNTPNILGQQQGQFAPMAAALGAALPAPFTWGAGGAQLSPEQLALRQKLAAQNQQTDYSPILSPWQGLARVAQNVMGALDQRALDKQGAAQQAQSNGVLQALAGSDPATVNPGLVAAALQSSDNQVQAFGKDVFDKAHPKQGEAGSIEKNYNFINGIDPTLGKSYLQAEANPQVLGTNPETGALQFFPKGGAQGGASALPQQPQQIVTPKTQQEYDRLPKGALFVDDDGIAKVKS
jgi:hypothetical protein